MKVQLDNLTADYQMPKDRQSVWITVGNIAVYIKQDDEGVAVDLFSANDETSDCLTSCWATYAEAEPDEDGTSGQDRKSYSDTQDRDNYTVSN